MEVNFPSWAADVPTHQQETWAGSGEATKLIKLIKRQFGETVKPLLAHTLSLTQKAEGGKKDVTDKTEFFCMLHFPFFTVEIDFILKILTAEDQALVSQKRINCMFI